MSRSLGGRLRAAAMIRRLPDFRGRQRVSRALLGRPDLRTTIQFGEGLSLELDLTDADDRLAFFLQSQPPVLSPIFDESLRPGDLVIDVGANIGIYSLWAAQRVGATGAVHAFEPIATTRQTLMKNVVQNGMAASIEVRSEAVGSGIGELTLFTAPGASGRASTYRRQGNVSAAVVPLTYLDGYCAERRISPRLVKIDVEGFEAEVLRGMSVLLTASAPPVVVLECVEEQLRLAGSSLGELTKLMSETPLTPWIIQPNGLTGFDERLADACNILLLHPEHHGDVLSRLREKVFSRDFFP